MNRNDRVSLRYGTLILIAIIVMILGNLGHHDSTSQINSLQQRLEKKIGFLEYKIDEQTNSIEKLFREVRKIQGPEETQ